MMNIELLRQVTQSFLNEVSFPIDDAEEVAAIKLALEPLISHYQELLQLLLQMDPKKHFEIANVYIKHFELLQVISS